MRIYLLVLLCTLVALPALAAPVTSLEQAVNLVVTDKVPQGRDEVIMEAWGPLPAGTVISGVKERVMVTPAEGYVIYIDDYPLANHFHPVRYAFIVSATGEVTVVDANSYPLNIEDYTEIETAIGERLKAVPNRRAPLPKDPPPQFDSERWAVLLNGGISNWSNYTRYWNDLSNIYIALNWVYGYADDHIIVLCSDGLDPAPDQNNGQSSDPDLDGDGDDDIIGPCLPNTIDAIFDSLAAILTVDDELYIFTTDHGSSNGGWNTSQNLWNSQTMTDAHFASLLAALPNCEIVFTLEPCYSGGFLDDAVFPPGPIVGSSACRYNQSSWAMSNMQYDEYVFHWTAAVKGEDAYGMPVDADYNSDGVITMDEAHEYAVIHDQQNEEPQYGDSPRGIGADISLWPASPPGNVEVTLTPIAPPIQIPATGGSFDFIIEIENFETTSETFNCWIDVTLPSGTITQPLLGPVSLTLPGNGLIERTRTQSIPENAPAGIYSYNAYVGYSSAYIWS